MSQWTSAGLTSADVVAIADARIIAANASRTPVEVINLIGNKTSSELNMMTALSGQVYVVTDTGTVGSLPVSPGDLLEYSGSSWVKIKAGVSGYVAEGVRAALSTSTPLSAPYTDGVDDGKIVLFDGTSLVGIDTTETEDGVSVIVRGENSVYENQQFVFDGTVPAGSWIQTSSVNPDDVTIEVSGGNLQVKDGGVTLPKLASIATDVVLGRSDPGTGIVQTIPCTAAGRALIGATGASAQRTALGLGTSDSPTFAGLTATGTSNLSTVGVSTTLNVSGNGLTLNSRFRASANDHTITADQNNYVLNTALVQRFSTDAARTITGFDKISDEMKFIENVGSNNLILANESTSSNVENRIVTGTGANLILTPNKSALLWYDQTTQRWRVVATTVPPAAIGGTVGTTNNAIPRADGTGGSTLKASSARITDGGEVQTPRSASAPVYTSFDDTAQGLWLLTTGRTRLSGGNGGGNTLELETGGGTGPVLRVNGNSASSNVYLFSGLTTNNVYSATRYEISSRLVDLFVGAAAEGVSDTNRRNSAFIGTSSGYPLRIFISGSRRAQFGSDSGTAPSLQVRGLSAGEVVLHLTSEILTDAPSEEFLHNRTTTTDATTTTLASIPALASRTVTLEVHVVARRTGGTGGTDEDGAAYGLVATIKNVGGTAVLIGTPTVLYAHEDQTAWDATIAVAGANALVQVTGAADNNVTWHAHIRRRYVGG